MDIQYITSPLIGAFIGFLTNGIAIRMLFFPLKPKYLFGKKIPFTPGLIPKEMGRLAKTIGVTISEHLMNKEVLEKTLLSEEMLEKITETIDNFALKQSENEESLREFLTKLISEDKLNSFLTNTKSDLAGVLQNKLSDERLGNQIAEIAVKYAIEKVKNGMLGIIGADKFLKLIAKPTEMHLAKEINGILSKNSKELITGILNDESEKALSMRMCDIVVKNSTYIEKFKRYAINGYKKIILEHLPRILETINISKIVEERINGMDIEEIESLIFQILKKEMNAIIYLGGVLGFLIGFFNVLF